MFVNLCFAVSAKPYLDTVFNNLGLHYMSIFNLLSAFLKYFTYDSITSAIHLYMLCYLKWLTYIYDLVDTVLN